MIQIVTFIAALSVVIWLYLIFFRGGFWRCDQRLAPGPAPHGGWPDIAVIIPARNEAALIGRTVRALMAQDYPGHVDVILVDDGSDDGTSAAARDAARTAQGDITIIRSTAPPTGWTGKLWALATGLQQAPESPFVLFTDADIEHQPATLRELVAKAEADQLDLVSLMALLSCETKWERLLVPAFVYFFQKLYPFSWANDPDNAMAAAAGGCVLLRRRALDQAGGIAAIKGALIDDCALARLIKQRGAIWLGLTETSTSTRPHDGLGDIWSMVARTAFDQLNYSVIWLIAAVLGMVVIYGAPPLALICGILSGDGGLTTLGFEGFVLMMLAYGPTLKLYRQPMVSAVFLPLAAALYMAMTVDSATRHWRGRGGQWKGRVHAP